MKFFRTLHWRIMAILFLLVIVLMMIIGTSLIYSMEDTYYKSFLQDIKTWDSNINTTEILSDNVLLGDNSESDLYKTLKLYFQIDGTSREGFLLDATGDVVYPQSTENVKVEPIIITDNIILALAGKNGFYDTNNKYFEFAKPIKIGDEVKYIFYLRQDRSTIDTITSTLKETIIYSVLVAIVVSIFISYFLSRAITVPLYKLKSRAEKMAEGDFTPISELRAGDEISELADKFNYMAERLNSTLAEISKEKNKIEILLQNMDDGVIAFDINGKLIHANNSAKKLLNIKDNEFKEELEKYNISLILKRMLLSDKELHMEQDICINDIYLKLFFAKFNNEKGEIGGIIVVIQDITKQEKLEKMRKDFVANVSHELKTPITSIKGYSETLLENNIDKEMNTKFLEVINSEADRMSGIVTSLLQLSKIDSKEIKLSKKNIDIVEMINELISKVLIEADKKKQSIIFNNNEVLYVYADRPSIEQVILNVLINSIKYTGESGEIEIFASNKEDMVEIKVRDNGIGIPKTDLPRIFERFYRVDKARTRQMGGTGLGLSISKNMVEANGGEIKIDSEFGMWTEVTILLEVGKNIMNLYEMEYN